MTVCGINGDRDIVTKNCKYGIRSQFDLEMHIMCSTFVVLARETVHVVLPVAAVMISKCIALGQLPQLPQRGKICSAVDYLKWLSTSTKYLTVFT